MDVFLLFLLVAVTLGFMLALSFALMLALVLVVVWAGVPVFVLFRALTLHKIGAPVAPHCPASIGSVPLRERWGR